MTATAGPNLKHARPVIRDLVERLMFRATYGRPCYIKRNDLHAVLIVPELTDGPDGPYSWVRTYRRTTIHEAVVLGYITLGPELVEVPTHSGAAGAWYRSADHRGYIIRAAGGEK